MALRRSKMNKEYAPVLEGESPHSQERRIVRQEPVYRIDVQQLLGSAQYPAAIVVSAAPAEQKVSFAIEYQNSHTKQTRQIQIQLTAQEIMQDLADWEDGDECCLTEKGVALLRLYPRESEKKMRKLRLHSLSVADSVAVYMSQYRCVELRDAIVAINESPSLLIENGMPTEQTWR